MISPGNYSTRVVVTICCSICAEHQTLLCSDEVEYDLRYEHKWSNHDCSTRWVCPQCYGGQALRHIGFHMCPLCQKYPIRVGGNGKPYCQTCGDLDIQIMKAAKE